MLDSRRFVASKLGMSRPDFRGRTPLVPLTGHWPPWMPGDPQLRLDFARPLQLTGIAKGKDDAFCTFRLHYFPQGGQ